MMTCASDLDRANTLDTLSQYEHPSPTSNHLCFNCLCYDYGALDTEIFFPALIDQQAKLSILCLLYCGFEQQCSRSLSLSPAYYQIAGLIIICKSLNYYFDPPPARANAEMQSIGLSDDV